MMIGIGTPSSHSRIPRPIDSSSEVVRIAVLTRPELNEFVLRDVAKIVYSFGTVLSFGQVGPNRIDCVLRPGEDDRFVAALGPELSKIAGVQSGAMRETG